MYPNYFHPQHAGQPLYYAYPVPMNGTYVYGNAPYVMERQPVRGQATWTEGGQVTQCGIPWSKNQYMTAAVSTNSPYKCGQSIKVTNLSQGAREIIVTVVDRVPGFPVNRINLHRRAFEALGTNPAVGVINIEINPSPELEQEKWGKYLLEVTQAAYPSYNVTDYNFVEKTNPAPGQTRETYEFLLQSPQENIKVRGNVIYNAETDRIISFNISER